MIFVARCGLPGSDRPFQLIVDFVLGNNTPPPITQEIYPNLVGITFGLVTWTRVGNATIRGGAFTLNLSKLIGDLENVLDSERFQVTPRQDGSGQADITGIVLPVYLSYGWNNCANRPPYKIGLSWAGSPFQQPVGLTFTFQLIPVLDRVTACSN